MEKVYLQTYSLGAEMQNDFAGSMRRIAELGYAGVEFAGGYGGLSVDDMKKLLAETGLDAICSHVGIDQAPGDIDFLAAIGARYIVCPMAMGMVIEYDAVMRLAEQLETVGKLCAAAGLKYGYHNHTQEFALINGKTYLEHLIENTDPSRVIFELDVGWATTAGINAVDFINKHAGRFELIHAKEADTVTGVQPPFDFSKIEFDENGQPKLDPAVLAKMKEEMEASLRMNAPQGKGIVDWKAVKSAADAQGNKAYIVEREWDYANDIWKCVTEDLAFMKTV